MTTTSPSRAGRREWLGLAVLALPTLLLALDMSVLYLALPQLSRDLGADGTQQLWIMDSYGFMIAGFLVTMGTLGDRIGRRRLLLIGGAAFGAASVLAALSTSPEMLIITRGVLGIAGATLMPSTLALLTTMFTDARQRGVAISVWMSCFMGGSALGPIIGGVLLERFWWGSAFLLGVPVMLVLLVTGPLLLPEYRKPDAGRIDLVSVGLSLAAILPVVYGLKELAKNGPALVPALAIVAGLVFGVTFARRQRRLPDPVLDLRLFANRTFSSALVVWLGFGVIQGGSYLFFTLYLQTVVGLTPLQAGLWLVLPALAMVLGSMAAPVIARRVRPGLVIASGLGVGAVAYLWLTGLDGSASLSVLLPGLVVSLIGLGLAAALGTELIVGAAPAERAGSAAALSETSGELGIALGVALVGSVVTAVYRDALTLPAGLPAQAAETAREGVASALAAAGRLPEPGPLLSAAKEAFTTAVTTMAGLSALGFALLAALAALTLRNTTPPDSANHGHTMEDCPQRI
ncbi:MFS transporter [Crossiella sp. CA-258035]|uniref:MFS transporter n=1 Tax=Crossiella sp. CA-258035 TaxID=2981138 RepID=UPI0024BC2322|nr:MFS transporter [Crossiella sp. CA-258035]WHT17127.1 MFS transporter [Crossiella sp. CA-258035]